MKFLVLLSLVFLSLPTFATQTALTVQDLSETEYQVSATAADQSNGNSIPNPNGDVFLLLSSTAGTCVHTIAAGQASVTVPGYGPLTKSNLAVSCGSGVQKLVGPFQSKAWNTSGSLLLSYTSAATASCTVKALRLSPTLR
jgi:hypothetical protein